MTLPSMKVTLASQIHVHSMKCCMKTQLIMKSQLELFYLIHQKDRRQQRMKSNLQLNLHYDVLKEQNDYQFVMALMNIPTGYVTAYQATEIKEPATIQEA